MLKILAVIFAVVIVALTVVFFIYKPALAPPTAGPVSVTMPLPGGLITSPVGIEGQAVGTWFNEGTFHVEVLDSSGAVLGQGQAQALGEWVTTSSVAFSANIPFVTPQDATGTILFMNDNPSGLPANQEQFTVEVRFK